MCTQDDQYHFRCADKHGVYVKPGKQYLEAAPMAVEAAPKAVPKRLTLKVPDGTSGGAVLNVRRNGLKYKVVVPEGLQPGDPFTADLGLHGEVQLGVASGAADRLSQREADAIVHAEKADRAKIEGRAPDALQQEAVISKASAHPVSLFDTFFNLFSKEETDESHDDNSVQKRSAVDRLMQVVKQGDSSALNHTKLSRSTDGDSMVRLSSTSAAVLNCCCRSPQQSSINGCCVQQRPTRICSVISEQRQSLERQLQRRQAKFHWQRRKSSIRGCCVQQKLILIYSVISERQQSLEIPLQYRQPNCHWQSVRWR